MCQHIVYVFSCQDHASQPIVIKPCKYGCSLYYADSAEPHNGFSFLYRAGGRIEIEYIDLNTACEECDPCFDPYDPVTVDETSEWTWHIPAIALLEEEIFRDVGWKGHEDRLDDQDGVSVVCYRDGKTYKHTNYYKQERTLVCISPKSKPPDDRSSMSRARSRTNLLHDIEH